MLRNFSWVIPHRLAGMALPTGAYWSHDAGDARTELTRDLQLLKRQGVNAVVSLTPEPLDIRTLRQFGMESLHLPVEDMSPPSVEQMLQFARFVDGRPTSAIVIHCSAGIGRTGSMLAAYLIWTGTDPESAINRIRRLRPGSIETIEQELALFSFETHLRREREKQG